MRNLEYCTVPNSETGRFNPLQYRGVAGPSENTSFDTLKMPSFNPLKYRGVMGLLLAQLFIRKGFTKAFTVIEVSLVNTKNFSQTQSLTS